MPTRFDLTNPDLREQLADEQHAIWSHWMQYLFSVATTNDDGSVTIPAAQVARWQRQMQTPYADLSEKEKASDRDQADKIIAVLGNFGEDDAH